MKRIYLVEYLNYVNENKADIGHGRKVLSDTFKMLSPMYDVVTISSEVYSKDISGLKKNIRIISQHTNGRIKVLLKKLGNIISSFMIAKDSIMWFTNVEWTLLAFMAIYKPKVPIVLTLYRNVVADMDLPGTKFKTLKKHLVKKGLSKADLLVVTNPNLLLANNQIHIPDYYYDDTYEKYQGNEKDTYVVCLGAMRSSKDLRGVVEHFSNTDINVKIIGHFSDKNEYGYLQSHRGKNIEIVDQKLPYDSYYDILSKAEFSIMPYDMKCYKEATSGILLESIFLNTIPIAPSEILKENMIDGIGYSNINELPTKYNVLHERGLNVKNNTKPYELAYLRSILFEKLNEI